LIYLIIIEILRLKNLEIVMNNQLN
jgi:hypothetical protein